MPKTEKPTAKVKIAKKKLVPITRREKLLTRIVENRGNVSKSMKEAGYSNAYAKNPKQLTGTKVWEELLEKYVPDDLLADKLNQLINKTSVAISTSGKVIEQPHSDVKGALDMAFKIKMRYASDKNEKESNKLTRDYLDRIMVDD